MAINLTPRQRAQYDELSMSEKIAILLIQLGDEITSEIFRHLDIDSIERLKEALCSFNCALLIVSHNRNFLKNIVNIKWNINREYRILNIEN